MINILFSIYSNKNENNYYHLMGHLRAEMIKIF